LAAPAFTAVVFSEGTGILSVMSGRAIQAETRKDMKRLFFFGFIQSQLLFLYFYTIPSIFCTIIFVHLYLFIKFYHGALKVSMKIAEILRNIHN
jgi:hypothetical protein